MPPYTVYERIPQGYRPSYSIPHDIGGEWVLLWGPGGWAKSRQGYYVEPPFLLYPDVATAVAVVRHIELLAMDLPLWAQTISVVRVALCPEEMPQGSTLNGPLRMACLLQRARSVPPALSTHAPPWFHPNSMTYPGDLRLFTPYPTPALPRPEPLPEPEPEPIPETVHEPSTQLAAYRLLGDLPRRGSVGRPDDGLVRDSGGFLGRGHHPVEPRSLRLSPAHGAGSS